MATAYTIQDLQITALGDLVVTPGGDLQIASIDQTTQQDVTINLYTPLGDFSALPYIGSMIEDYIGQPNTRSNAQSLQSEMIRALTANGRFVASDITITIVPTDIDAITSYINVQNAAGLLNRIYVYDFSYIGGLSLLSQG